MKNHIDNREVQSFGAKDSSTFSIKANGKAFKILIDGLYSDKIRAVIRELWSNAFDSHAASGKLNKPFECHLPTLFEPYFSVRDFGTSMTHEQVMHLYTTVFESSKEDTNDQVGKLGLGSKSPFAYTDIFTVVARDGKTKRTYSAYIGSDYVPRLDFLAEEESSEGKGIEVSFPVKTTDISPFVKAAQFTGIGFDVKPKISGNNTFAWKTFSTKMSGKGWVLMKDESSYDRTSYAKQGCVVYPLDLEPFEGKLNATERAVLSGGFHIDFPIGDLEINASREGLGYNDTTKENIRRRVSEIAVEITEQFKSSLDDCRTMWEAAIFKRRLIRSIPQELQEIVRQTLCWRGREIVSAIDLRPLLQRTNNGYQDGKIACMMLASSTINAYGSKKRSLKFEANSYLTAAPGEIVILFEDPDHPVSQPASRIRHWYPTLGLKDPEMSDANVLWVKTIENSVAFKRLLVTLGRPVNIVRLADLPRPPIDKNNPSRKRVSLKRFEVGMRASKWWSETSVDMESDDEIYYVDIDRNEMKDDNDKVVSGGTISSVVKNLISLGVLDANVEVIGVPRTHKNIPLNNDNWVPLFKKAREYVQENFDPVLTGKSLAARREVMSASAGVENFAVKFIKKSGVFHDCEGVFARYVDAWSAIVKFSERNTRTSCLGDLAATFEIQPTVFDWAISKETTKVKKTYPMLAAYLNNPDENRYVRNGVSDTTVTKNALQYIDLIDADLLVRQSVEKAVA